MIKTLTNLLPAGYTELEYLENTNTCWIDAGIKATNNSRVEIGVMFNNSGTEQCAIGSRDANSSRCQYIHIYSGRFCAAIYYTFDSSGDYVTANTKYDLTSVINGMTMNVYNGSTLVSTVTGSGSLPDSNITLFRRSLSTSATILYGKIYYCRIYISDVLTRNFIPAKRNSDNVLGMYDTISGTFFTNAGSGTFAPGPEVTTPTKELKEVKELYKSNGQGGVEYIGEGYTVVDGQLEHIFSAGYDTQVAGTTSLSLPNARAKSTTWEIDGNSSQSGTPTPTSPLEVKGVGNGILPSGYKKLEYIQSSGTQYIDTGIAENINIQLEFHLHNTATGLIAGSIASYNAMQHIRVYKGTSVSTMSFGNQGLASNAGDFPKLVDGTKHEVIFDKTGITIDGTLTPFSSVATVVQYTDNICIFGAPTGGYNGKPAIYDFKIYNGCVLVRNLIPAQRISDSEIGMYDTVTNTFFTNSGTGTFIAGPEDTSYVVPVMVNREDPVEYKQLEYITAQSTGPYIQLNNGFDVTDEVEIKTQIKNTGVDRFLVAPTTWNTSSNRFAMCGNGPDIRRGVGFGGATTGKTQYNNPIITPTEGQITTETYSNRLFTITGENINSTCDCSSITWSSATDNLKLFYGYNATTNGTIYYWKHKKVVDGVLTLVENLVPVQRISDSEIGMYDTVSKTFFTNAGTGTFTAGPEVGTVYNINLPAPLQKIGTYKDSIESDGTLTRGVGVKVFDGTESWTYDSTYQRFYVDIPGCVITTVVRTLNGYCTHYKVLHNEEPISQVTVGDSYFETNASQYYVHDSHTSVDDFKSWLAAQYAAGTPVTLYYPLATATETSVQVPTISTNKGDNTIIVSTEVAPSNTEFTYRKRTK